jgi:hypothetical protein
MADTKKGEKQVDKPKKRGKGGFLLAMTVFGLSFWFIFPTVILVLVGMSPTFIALLMDNDRQKSSASAIGSLNAAGVVPFVIDLWQRGQSIENTFHILAQPANWLIMLGAAGVGQLILFAVPQAVATWSLTRSEVRLKILRSNLESLRNAWGPDVATNKPLDQIGKMG